MRAKVGALVAFLLLALFVAIPAPAASAAAVSDTGRAAIDDLRTCLSSSDVLNVYYLIDNSGSLREPDGTGSDPDYERAGILAGSLAALQGLRSDLTVNWGAGFFSGSFEPAVSWQQSTGRSPDELAEAIRAEQPSGGTDWLDGLRGVQAQLQSQPSAGSACQLVIWMTDGRIDLGGDQATADAINALCGVRVDPAGAAPNDYGLLASLRQSGVVILGTLLADGTTREDAGIMYPLVEGTGTYRGETVTCGPPVEPVGAVHGAVVDASDPTALASVFLELGSRIGGGYPQPLEADGSFWIDAGVSRVQLVVSDPDWTLEAPAASGLGTLSAANTDGVGVTESSGATLIEIPVDSADRIGSWKLTAPGTEDAYFFSDLRIVFDETNRIQRAADGSLQATLGAQVQDADGAAADLSVFGQATFSGSYTAGDATGPLPGATIDATTGAITLPLPPDVTAAEIVVSASLDPLVTAPHGVPLAPITTEQRVATVLPAGFPSVSSPVTLSELTGRDGEATGSLVLQGPTEGETGQVCLTATPTITSDNADRASGWSWTFADESGTALPPGTCIVVPQDSTQTITVTARNATPADASVVASLPLEIRSAAGGSVPQAVSIEFPSTHPVNTLAVLLLTLALILLGLLIPLLLLYLLNRRAAVLSTDGSFMRAVVPAEITADGIRLLVSDEQLADRFGYLGRIEKQRRIPDGELGGIRATVPPWPLRSPRFVVGPPADGVVVAAGTKAGRPWPGTETSSGGRSFSALPLDAFWAVVVRRDALAGDTDAVPATAVLYHRVDPTDPDQYRTRAGDLIAAAGTAIHTTVERLRRARAATGRGASAQTAGSTSGEDREQIESAAPPGAGTPPRAPASPPRSTSAGPPPRPGSTPGSAPGHAPPPPRPGSQPDHRPPPPRPGS